MKTNYPGNFSSSLLSFFRNLLKGSYLNLIFPSAPGVPTGKHSYRIFALNHHELVVIFRTFQDAIQRHTNADISVSFLLYIPSTKIANAVERISKGLIVISTIPISSLSFSSAK